MRIADILPPESPLLREVGRRRSVEGVRSTWSFVGACDS